MSRLVNLLKATLFTLCLPAMIWHAPASATPTIQKVNTSTTWSPWDLLNYDTLSYQRITDFLWEVAYGETLEKNLSSAQANQVMNFVIFLARNGLQDDAIEGKSALEEDIKWLRGEPNNSTLALDDDDDERSEAGNWWWNTSLKGYENYGVKVTPAVLYRNQSPRILNCGWISESWKATKKFVKKHKKEVIIAAVVVVAATVVIVATSGAAMPAVVGGAVAASADSEGNGDLKPKGTSKPRTPVNKPGEIYEPYDGNNHDTQLDNTHRDYDQASRVTPKSEPTPEKNTLLIETIERQNTTLKEELSQELLIASEGMNVPKEEMSSFWSQAADKAREVGSVVVHEVYDGVTEQLKIILGATGYISEKLNNTSEYFKDMDPFEKDPREAFQESVVTGHEKIDAVFGTEHANMYTDEAKETRDKLTTGVLPPPGGFSNVAKNGKPLSQAYITAKNGGKHSKLIAEYGGRSTREIEKSIRSYEKQIIKHKDKIANPSKYVPEWDSLHPNQKKSLLEKGWPKEIKCYTAQKEILEGILIELE
ncbi:hypothetical protein [Candidatus Neptunichlamydia sp. REUL1]|uniref:hypothetical protein n=1 Tax=Candidatus Neptunichlamydia sp. REUL1 TaxID=3064277 RepID=UPI002930AC49|nr:hypothetical protein [Candidatus Neptunochlamydia sp. REUL1]